MEERESEIIQMSYGVTFLAKDPRDSASQVIKKSKILDQMKENLASLNSHIEEAQMSEKWLSSQLIGKEEEIQILKTEIIGPTEELKELNDKFIKSTEDLE